MCLFFRRRGHGDEAEDRVQLTFLRVWKAPTFPTDRVEQVKYVFACAGNVHASHVRKKKKDAARAEIEFHADVESDAPDAAQAADMVAERELLDRIEAGVPEEHRSTWRLLLRHMLGETITEIAEEANLEYDVVYKRVTTLKRRVRDQGIALASLAVLAIVVHLVVALGTKPPMAQDPLPETPTRMPASSTHETEPQSSVDPAIDQARELREKGFAACRNKEWEECGTLLEKARKLDPKGERDRVRAALREVSKALDPAHDKDQREQP
jgi:DNA-directed RNA polymerase specialized sigma24 family protein